MIRLKVGDFRPPSAPADAPGISLKEARVKARETKQQIHDGIDPNAERKAARAGNPDAVTIAKLFELREATPAINGTWKEYKRAISQVFAKHLDTPLPKLTRRDLKATANALASRGVDSAAAAKATLPVLQRALEKQVLAISFNEAFFALVLLFAVAAPCLIVVKQLLDRHAARREEMGRGTAP